MCEHCSGLGSSFRQELQEWHPAGPLTGPRRWDDDGLQDGLEAGFVSGDGYTDDAGDENDYEDDGAFLTEWKNEGSGLYEGTSTQSHRVRQLSREELDKRPTTSWAIGWVGSFGSFYAGYAVFDLLNRETGRAHALHVPNLQLSVGIPYRFGKRTRHLPSPSAGAPGGPSYVMFDTSRPMSFDDFNGVRCRLTTANMALFWGYSVLWLTIWRRAFYIGDQVAYVRMSGSGLTLLPGGSVGHGVGFLKRGSGQPLGSINVPLVLVPQEEDYVPDPRLVNIKLDAREDRPISLPSDILFDFNSAELRADARMALTYIADLLNNRRQLPVTIEGHTDSVGEKRTTALYQRGGPQS